MRACVTVYVGVDWKFVLGTATSTVGSGNTNSWSLAPVLQIACPTPGFYMDAGCLKPELHACAVGIFLSEQVSFIVNITS